MIDLIYIFLGAIVGVVIATVTWPCIERWLDEKFPINK